GQAMISGNCAPGTQPKGIPFDRTQRADLMNDVLVKAFECDATRVATMMLGRCVSPMQFTVDGVTYQHHSDASHWGGDQTEKHAKDYIDNSQVGRLAHLLQGLSVKDPMGISILDNAAIFYSSDVGDPNSHSHENMPVLVAGKLGGALKGGQHIKTGIVGRTTG